MDDKPFSLLDLINEVGLDNIEVQSLLASLTKVTSRKKLGGTEVSFITNQMKPDDVMFDPDNRKIGLVLWIPKNKIPKVKSPPAGVSF